MEKPVQELLGEVFGDPTNVTPTGTGAVLTTPSKLSFDLVSEVVRKMPADRLRYEIGRLAAKFLADELERQGLKPADYVRVPDLQKVLARRISSRLHDSEQFYDGLFEGLMVRG